MTIKFNGPFYALPNDDGSWSVGIALPSGHAIKEGSFRVFLLDGPSFPTSSNELKQVSDLDEYLDTLRASGFVIKETSMREILER